MKVLQQYRTDTNTRKRELEAAVKAFNEDSSKYNEQLKKTQ